MKSYLKTLEYKTFNRYCKVLQLRDDPGLIEKYREVHKPENIWPIVWKRDP